MRRTWHVLLWSALLLGVISAGALFEPPDDTLLRKALLDAGHALLGGLLCFFCLRWILAWEERTVPTRRDQGLAFVAAGLAGLFFELVQLFLPRDADLTDVWRDLLGAAAFLLLAWSSRRNTRAAPTQRLLAGAAALALLAIAFLSAARLARAVEQRNQAFPVLCEPGAPWIRPFLALQHVDWELTRPPSAWVDADSRKPSRRVARVTFHRGPFPGFALRETAPDWRRYETLALEMYSALTVPIDVILRVDDVQHDETYRDRFNQRLHVVPGGQVFRIPLESIRLAPATREMDLAHVRRLVVFSIETEERFSLYVGTIRLE